MSVNQIRSGSAILMSEQIAGGIKMRKKMNLAAILICCICFLFPSIVMADAATGGEYNYQEADYDVVVSAPDGYVNFRYGPGLEYGICCPIYNGEYLHINATMDNYYDGLAWGQTVYGGNYGWISLSQTTPVGYALPEPETTIPVPMETTVAPEVPVPASPKTEPTDSDLVTTVFETSNENGTYKIPEIQIGGMDVHYVNSCIFSRLYGEILEARNSDNIEVLIQSDYEWYVNGDVLSLVICCRYGGPWHEYMVYNLSVSEQRILSDPEVFHYAGMSESEYYEKTTACLENAFQEKNGPHDDGLHPEIFASQHDKTVADTNIQSCMPYLDSEGQLNVVGCIYLYGAQLDCSWEKLPVS